MGPALIKAWEAPLYSHDRVFLKGNKKGKPYMLSNLKLIGPNLLDENIKSKVVE